MQSFKKIVSDFTMKRLFWLVLGTAHFGSDALAKAQGRLAEETMAVTDWQLVGLTQNEDGTLTTVDGDPQMILEDVAGQVVRTLSYTVTFDGDAREMCLYYTTKVGEDYSQDRRVFPQNLGDGHYLYTLPRTSIAALRLDPCSPDENKTVDLTFAPAALTLNAADTLPSWWQYLVPSWYQTFCLILYPALCASAVSLIRSFFAKKEPKKL